MKVHSVGNYKLGSNINSQFNKNTDLENKYTFQNELITSEMSLAFKSQILPGFRRPVIKNNETKIVYDKVLQIFKKLPNSAKMTRPILIKAGEENYGFTWDKTYSNKCKLLIKNNINSVEDWEKSDPSRSVMSCLFDKNGMMLIGELIRPLKTDYSQGVFYHHEGRHGRKIRLDDLTLKPTAESDTIWSIIPFYSTRNTSGDIDLAVKLKGTMLSDLFLELTKKKTSIII